MTSPSTGWWVLRPASRDKFARPLRLIGGVMMLVSTYLAANVANTALHYVGANTIVVFMGTNGTAIVYAFAIYQLFKRSVEKRPATELVARDAPSAVSLGFIQGTLLFFATIGIITAAGGYQIVGSGMPAAVIASLISAATAAVVEELLFRGILFRLLEQMTGSWVALAVSAAFFGGVHSLNPSASWVSTVAIALEAGLLLGGCFMRYRTLWVPIGLHMGWNFAEGGIFGTAVSGGQSFGLFVGSSAGPAWLTGGRFGPEASLPAVVVALLLAAWFLFAAWKRGRTFSRGSPKVDAVGTLRTK